MTALLAALCVLLAVSLVAFARRLSVLRRRLRRSGTRVGEPERSEEEGRGSASRFMDTVAHELRTPLATIVGYQELLAEGAYGPLPERAAEPLARIASAAQRLALLLDAALELGRSGTGPAPEPRELELAPVLERAARRARAMAAEPTTELRLPDRVTPARVIADPARFARVVELAIAAALHASPGAVLRLSAEAALDGGLALTVAGTGLRHGALDDGVEAGRDTGRLAEARGGLPLVAAAVLARELGGRLSVEAGADDATLRLELAAPRRGTASVRASESGSAAADPAGAARESGGVHIDDWGRRG